MVNVQHDGMFHDGMLASMECLHSMMECSSMVECNHAYIPWNVITMER